MLGLANSLVALFPEKKLTVVRKNFEKEGYIPSQFSRIVADIGKARRDLGWQPRVSVEEGFRRTIMSFKQQ